MLLKRNLLECTTIVSCAGTFICVLLNYITNISPITGIWFPLYIITLFIVSLCVSFKFIQWLLRLNKPIKYDLDGIVADYPYLSLLSKLLPRPRKVVSEIHEYDTNELSVISTVLERKLVSSWYVPYISQEIGFPFACKQMLDQMIGKSFQICNKIETKDVFVDITTVLSSHLKEYQKALKRKEKTPDSTVEALYKKTHRIFDVNNKMQPADHCTNLLRVIFKELVPWELWDTPHSELLIRILSKKLHTFIDTTLADPAWLNEKLLTILKGKQKSVVTEEKKEPVIPEPSVIQTNKEPISVEKETPVVVTKATVTVPQCIPDIVKEKMEVEKIENIVEEVPVTSSEPVDIKASPILRQRRGRQGRNEVKIYDRIIEGSVKTWETDIDLQCISLGQDLLASLDGEITLSRLWGQDADTEGSPNPPRSKSPQPLWFGEEETIEVDPLDSNSFKESKKEQSPKPADALLKDLQSTVREAKTKIGDLQDEAAGMMEGLLDFGIAGLKKGLRFTGLSDDSDKSPSHHRERPGDKASPPESRSKHVVEHKDHGNGQRDENNVPPLVKQHRVTSQDSVPSQPRPVPLPELPLAPVPDSPEPEYEEAADLSTSIAKLRCLLQQRAETSPKTEEVWWESAAETRGRTQRAPPAPGAHVDTATLADEYDMNMERNSSPGQTSNNMQRLDKLFQRTVTGVFNSIKTAVGAEDDQPAPRAPREWTYVCTAVDLNVSGAVGRVLGSRRAAWHVDAALDSLAQLAPRRAPRPASPDDFDEWCASCGGGWSCACAAAAAAGLAHAHVAHRLATLLLADLAESLLDAWLADLATWLRRQVFVIFEQLSESDADFFQGTSPRELNVDETCTALLENTPALLYVFGEETVSQAIRLVVTSFTHKEVNMDVIFRVLDLFAGNFKKSAGLRNPSFDSN
ncbi:uncharacterized protein LOC111354342 isoform X2 [Spodoptera litura]|uniref:Uncharacterized protein LOC111354342 isoform X2 n=1 Tax=Spodoptera litura TaxID=69820 RepID=A0A9J7E832_SPOLT|nr:uncharacterized protein LOC111354342 isoform X2 [Spodoptera litura]